MLKISKFVTGILDTNVYFIYDTDTHKCVLIDPADQADHIINIIDNELHVEPVAILLTHGHFDHMIAASEVSRHYNIRIYVNELDAYLLTDKNLNLSTDFDEPVAITKDEFDTYKDGQVLKYLGRDFKVIGTPGHTPGSSCFYIEDGLTYTPDGSEESRIIPVLISGDTLFKMSYGRTDFPGGSQEAIFNSIKEKLLVLPSETTVFPGHGPQSSIGIEQKYNPAAF